MLTIFLFFYGSVAYGQSKSEVATEKNSVTKEAQSQLAVLSSENGALNVYCKENSISGEFVMDLTIQGKGKLVTIYMVSRHPPRAACASPGRPNPRVRRAALPSADRTPAR